MNICVIPARGGSKRIPNKNEKIFLGKPIIVHAIELALSSGLFTEVMVSTDVNSIAVIALEHGAKVPFFRSSKNSDDFATTKDVLNEVINWYIERGRLYENLCCIYPTAVLATVNDLVKGMNLLLEADEVLPVVAYSYPPQRSFLKEDTGLLRYRFKEYVNARSQDLEPWLHDAGQWYWYKVDSLTKSTESIIRKYILKTELEVQDIDNIDDWILAELKYKMRDPSTTSTEYGKSY